MKIHTQNVSIKSGQQLNTDFTSIYLICLFDCWDNWKTNLWQYPTCRSTESEKPAKASDVATKPTPSLIIKAEPTVGSILKVFTEISS